MFTSVISLTLLASAVAFSPLGRVTRGALSMSDLSRDTTTMEVVPEEEPVMEAVPPVPTPPAPTPRRNAPWFPLGGFKAPKVLDGELPGDVGFDPLGFSKNKNTLYWMREAELKHARLAMLAAAGWPLSELYHKQIADVFGLNSILASGDRAPSLLNGGLDSIYASGILMMSIIFAGYLEGKAMNDGSIFIGAEKPEGYEPGSSFKFDPLNLNSERNKLAEIKNGRLAMIAITAFAYQEAFTGVPVVQETPYLF